MIAYLDSSVLLRVVLGETGRLAEWGRIETGVSSALTEVECLRTLDRLLAAGRIPAAEIVARRAALYRFFEALDMVEITRPVLRRAAEPYPTPLGTLDAIHLSTALLWQEHRRTPLVMATHDSALGMAARACGLSVAGVVGLPE